MNFIDFEHFSNHEYPAIKLDMINFLEDLSDEYICGEAEVRDDSKCTHPTIIKSKTEEYTNLGETSYISGSGNEREEKVQCPI